MKKSKIAGWKDIYIFTLTQTLKSKAFLVSFVLMILLGLVSMPIMSLIQKNAVEEETYNITKVYIYDEIGLTKDAALLESALQEAGWRTEAEICDMADYGGEEFEKLLEEIDDQKRKEVVLHIALEEGIEKLHFLASGKGDVSSAEVDRFGQTLMECYTRAKYEAFGITEEQERLINAGVVTEVSKADLQGNDWVEEDTSISGVEYGFMYGLLFVIMMICTMTGSQVATAIITEKSSKVVEYLLTSVRPLAIIVGKVLAMLCAVLGEVICMIIVFAASNHVTEHYINGGESILEKYLTPELIGALNIGNVLICLLFIALGLVFYATLAGLAGATVSKMEEAGEGLVLFTIAVLVGAYLGIGAAGTLLGTGENAFVTFAFLFPLSSPFILPGAILVGKASVWVILVSIILLAAIVMLLFAFVARVYETLIVHNGSKIGIRQLLKMK